ncbi:helix-turn-helix domain-containing protein [Desmospora activa]|uniref:Tetratricopeptide repeat protein n=1 Tax=Desmospora activa DSM 45169 TaxID=1121389 RepID=A0A2T4Z4Y1_9BACL|nr:tetratricopeptide repeat protein [Desmospora activa]PTM56948.1 tetratricopeptide repeat protein [Desmospora activa DSM 45169]
MKTVELHEIGEIIRKVRKQRGFRLEDLADDNISPATISNIERGVPHVSMNKALYLLEKLNIETHQVPYLLMEEENEIKSHQLDMDMIETLFKLNKHDQALKEIEELNLEDNHPLAATASMLKGRCLNAKGQHRRAERAYYQAIKLANQHPYNQQTNVEASSFCDLGVCAYLQNDLESAIQFTNSGIDAYKENGDRSYLRYNLLRNKAIYLERLGHIHEGMRVVEEIWDERFGIYDVDTLLTIYWARIEFLRRTGCEEEAIKCAQEGLKLSIRNQHYRSIFETWTQLGCIYTTLGDLAKGEACFTTALQAKDFLPDQRLASTTYVMQGLLYLHLQKYAEAKESFAQAIQISEKANDAPRLIYALIGMGDYMKENEELKDAIPYYQRTLELAQKHKLKKQEYKALYKLAECWNAIDEKEFINCMRNMYAVKKELEEEGDFFGEMD